MNNSNKVTCERNFSNSDIRHHFDASTTQNGSFFVVEDCDAEDEEDCYEEMDEEDDEPPPLDVPITLVNCEDIEPACGSYSFNSTLPRCIVCCRTPTPKVRLFKWPEDQNVRKSWLAFFHLEIDLFDSCKVPYICNIHFDANQFLYEGDRVYWKKDSFPKFRQRRSILAEPFPWEVALNIDKKESHASQPHRQKQVLLHEHKVAFRESFYKSKSKSSHPVAVVSLPGNSNIFYEFSYTRTSSVDSSKFYSCLSCRKAKIDSAYTTRVKDVIRTIHIKDGTIRSRGDPFWGHHFACRPFTSTDVHGSACVDTLYPNYFGLHEMQHVEGLLGEQKFNTQREGKNSMQHIRTVPEASSSQQLHGRNLHRCDVEHRSRKPDDYSSGASSAFSSKFWWSRQRGFRLLPQCHLCRKVLPSTRVLVQHLQRHLKLAPHCKICGSKISPDDPARFRRARKCCKCIRRVRT